MSQAQSRTGLCGGFLSGRGPRDGQRPGSSQAGEGRFLGPSPFYPTPNVALDPGCGVLVKGAQCLPGWVGRERRGLRRPTPPTPKSCPPRPVSATRPGDARGWGSLNVSLAGTQVGLWVFKRLARPQGQTPTGRG